MSAQTAHETLEAARSAVAAAARRAAAQGLAVGTGGNASARVGEHVAITATGTTLETLSAEQVTVVDLSGAPVLGDGAPSSELPLHLGIYRRIGAGAILHTHSPAATALACTDLREVPCVHYAMLAFGGAVPVAPYATFGTADLADAVIAALERGRSAALMANHGAVVCAQDLAHAVDKGVLLEWVCEVYSRAAALGTPRVLSPDDLQRVADQVAALSSGGGRETRPS